MAVTTTADTVDGNTGSFASLNSQPGGDSKISLREAILASNATLPTTLTLTITFNIPTSDARYNATSKTWTIGVGSADNSGLPPLTRGNVRINGSTQPGDADHPRIALDGFDDLDTPANGLLITSANNMVRGLAITNFFHNGIMINGSTATNNQVAGCYIGANSDGLSTPPAYYNNGVGVMLQGGARSNLIGGAVAADRNLISGNVGIAGVWIQGSTTMSNTVAGNWIGPDATGLAGLGNEGAGVYISDGAHHNTIGGNTASARNLIAGNTADSVFGAVWISGATTAYNTVAGNWIGVDATGLAALPNAVAGVNINDSAHHNLVGGAGQGNIISANDSGVTIRSGAYNTVAGNTVGLAVDGKVGVQLGNRDVGIYVIDGAHDNLIGGTTAAARNIISKNGLCNQTCGSGIYISNLQTINNTIQGNYIGVDASGILPAGNAGYGVLISFNATDNIVGGSSPGAGNVIAYNGYGGISLNADHNVVAGNLVGIGKDGKTGLGNQRSGVQVWGKYNVIGPDNLIAYNQRSGVELNGDYTTITTNTLNYNAISGIELSGSYTTIISNALEHNATSGICVMGSSTKIISNSIAYNGGVASIQSGCSIQGGVVITGTGKTEVISNSILSNLGDGITVQAALDNRINANSISDNAIGIALLDGGNAGIAPPINLYATSSSVSGRSCPGCHVEIFTDADGEGLNFIDATTALLDGSFAITLASNVLDPPFVTATSTDLNGNTSPFTDPVDVILDPQPTPKHVVWAPIIRMR